MRERDCKSARCSDGECGYCKRVRKARGERNGKWLIDKMREHGILPDLMAEAEAIVGKMIDDSFECEFGCVPLDHGIRARFDGDLVEWF